MTKKSERRRALRALKKLTIWMEKHPNHHDTIILLDAFQNSLEAFRENK